MLQLDLYELSMPMPRRHLSLDAAKSEVGQTSLLARSARDSKCCYCRLSGKSAEKTCRLRRLQRRPQLAKLELSRSIELTRTRWLCLFCLSQAIVRARCKNTSAHFGARARLLKSGGPPRAKSSTGRGPILIQVADFCAGANGWHARVCCQVPAFTMMVSIK